MVEELEKDLFEIYVFSGNTEKVKEMIDSGVDLNRVGSNGLTPLVMAVEGDQPEILELLLKNGADPNKQSDLDGFTPLHWAVDYAIDGMIQSDKTKPFPEPLECIRILLNHGADAKIKNNSGKTAWGLALDYTVSKEILNDIFPVEILQRLEQGEIL